MSDNAKAGPSVPNPDPEAYRRQRAAERLIAHLGPEDVGTEYELVLAPSVVRIAEDGSVGVASEPVLEYRMRFTFNAYEDGIALLDAVREFIPRWAVWYRRNAAARSHLAHKRMKKAVQRAAAAVPAPSTQPPETPARAPDDGSEF